ncbi:ATP-binding protein [Niallia sp. 01092]|uniref:ATP-binding protein n=1 Tax=unclassified Niallia TaxID=2837522 RepID=UPI003FD32C1F
MFRFDNYLLTLLIVLVPALLYYNYFYKKELDKDKKYILGLFCSLTVILSMSFPLKLAPGHFYDLRAIPWLISFFYGGYEVGIITTIVIFVYRFLLGVNAGFFITIICYSFASFFVLFFIKKYQLLLFRNKLIASVIFTLISNSLIILAVLYTGKVQEEVLPSFIAYFYVSHIVTIIIVIYIIETLQEKELNKVKIQQSERIKIIGEMAASVAHEIRNPLTVVKGFIQLLKSDTNLTTKQVSSIDLIQSELLRAENIINDYLSLAKTKVSSPEQIDMKEIIFHVVEVAESFALLNNVTIINKVNRSFYIEANSNEISQVLLNIMKNGIEAIEEKGELIINAEKRGGNIEIQITDTGKGMTKEQIKRLGSPFYTTKDQGTGLGTMVCFKIIHNLHGDIKIHSKINQGTTFEITIPLLSS